jgi:RNA polymerase sigma factor (sigma-70 family)
MVIDQFRAGDIDALEHLWAMHLPRLTACVHHYLAGDALEETYVTVYERRATFRGHGSLAGWMLTICRNRCRMLLRAARRERQLRRTVARITDGIDHSASAELDAREWEARHERAMEALCHLSPRRQAMIRRYIMLDRDAADVAAELRCSPSTVYTTTAAALAHLRRLLREPEE